MKQTIELVGLLITLPFLALEAGIKIIMCILYFPILLTIAVFYPLVKRWINIVWMENWKKYATKWKKGFKTAFIWYQWKVVL